MNRLLVVLLIVAGFLTLPTPPARAAVGGDLDLSFSGDGKYVGTDLEHQANQVAVQDDGKILVVGTSGYWATIDRFRSDGTLDTTFGDDGTVRIDFGTPTELTGAAVQDDGRIVVVGQARHYTDDTYDVAIARVTATGALDPTFRGDGKSVLDLGYREHAEAVTIAPDGRIVVVGDSLVSLDYDFLVARFTATSGARDTSFSSDGRTTTGFGGENDAAYDVAVQSDGRVVVAGRTDDDGDFDFDFAVARYTTSGSLDRTFDLDGKASTGFGDSDEGMGVAIQSDGKIVVAGHNNPETEPSDFAVARYTSSGRPDTSFDGDGKLTTGIGATDDWGEDVVIQADGRIVVVGRVRRSTGGFDVGLTRYNQGGSLNSSFGGDGRVRTNVGVSMSTTSAAIQPGGKIVVGGDYYTPADNLYRVVLARYHWTTDPVPNTYVDSGPVGPTTDTTPTFTFHASESGVKYECTVATTYSPCTSPKTFTTLSPGDYTFKVRAIDKSAQTDPTPATRSFTITP